MKKLFYLFAVVAVVASLASCNKKDEPAEENKLEFEAALDATYASMGYYEIYGMTKDAAWGIDTYVYGFQSLTEELTDDNFYNPTLYQMDAAGEKVKAQFPISDIKLKGSVDEAQTTWTLTGAFTANDVEYKVTLAVALPEPADPYEWDEDSADYAENFATYTIDDEYLAEDGDIVVKAENDNNGYVALDFYVPEGATGLVAGEYTVSDSEDAMTVYAGQGDGSYIYYSFAAYTTTGGIEKVWYLVSGKVTVNADGSIVVAAKNSNGKNINCTLTAPAAEGGGDVAAPAKKARKAIAKGVPAPKHAF